MNETAHGRRTEVGLGEILGVLLFDVCETTADLRGLDTLVKIINILFNPVVIGQRVLEAVNDEGQVTELLGVIALHRVGLERHLSNYFLDGPGWHGHLGGARVHSYEADGLADLVAQVHGHAVDLDVVQGDTEHQLVQDGMPYHIARVLTLVVVAKSQL